MERRLVKARKCTAMCGGVAFLILMRPEGRKAGGEKIKTPRSGVIIFFSLFVKSLIVIKTVKIALTLTDGSKKCWGVRGGQLSRR